MPEDLRQIRPESEEEFNEHVEATQGVHGIGDSGVASQDDIDAAESSAVSQAESYTNQEVSSHENSTQDVHGVGSSDIASQNDVDNAESSAVSQAETYTNQEVSSHEDTTTGVHGVGGSAVASQSDVDSEVTDHENSTQDVHGVGSSDVASQSDVDSEVTDHASETSTHGASGDIVGQDDTFTGDVDSSSVSAEDSFTDPNGNIFNGSVIEETRNDETESLTVEERTSDPSSPDDGRVWVRSDLI